MLNKIILKIKRKENFLYTYLYNIAKYIKTFNLPVIKIIHLPLYHVGNITKKVFKGVLHVFWSIPLFKARCKVAGKNLSLPNGVPLVVGSNLTICLGDNVSIGRSTIGANKIYDEPVLTIGNNTALGYGTVISVAKEISIGNNCLIAPHCLIMDSDDHPINPEERRLGKNVRKENIFPVTIGDNVWIGSYCAILKGVKIGNNSIIGAHSVVTKDVAPNCVYAGCPAKLILREIDKL